MSLCAPRSALAEGPYRSTPGGRRHRATLGASRIPPRVRVRHRSDGREAGKLRAILTTKIRRAPAVKREAEEDWVGNDGCFACLKCRATVFGNGKNITVAECCNCTVAGIAPLGQSKDNHDLARFVIALHKKAPVTVYRPPGLSIRRSASCHSPQPWRPSL